ncbi:MAG: phosphoglycerate kinase [Bdellovibrionales bacterium]|nr:phosphoglycerate kinase [Bdellovibrionales bacterium]
MASTPTSRIKSIRDFTIRGKRVFMRLDFNVPLSAPDAQGHRHVEDDTRIREALPTIKYAIEQGAKIIIGSHLGRPKGKRNDDYSMLPAAHHLAGLLETEVHLADDCVGEGIELRANTLVNGEILILENLRFYPEEEANDLAFTQKLARLCDIYITDAFGTAHRKHASTYRLPSIVPDRGMGFLIEKEVKYFDGILHNPAQPFYLILGGAKVSDKIKTIYSLMKRVKGVVVGGAMAYAFMKAQGQKIEAEWKQPAPEDVNAAKEILKESEKKGIPFLLPLDTNRGFDIGSMTIKKYAEFLSHAKTVFWNGPLGWFEKPDYADGTFEIAKTLAATSCIKVVGGGDTVAAINQAGLASRFDHLSTGGGAALEYLENGGLPGIDILKSGHRPESPDLVWSDDPPARPEGSFKREDKKDS